MLICSRSRVTELLPLDFRLLLLLPVSGLLCFRHSLAAPEVDLNSVIRMYRKSGAGAVGRETRGSQLLRLDCRSPAASGVTAHRPVSRWRSLPSLTADSMIARSGGP